MFSPVFSTGFSIAIFVVFVALPSSNGVDDWYKTCSSLLFSCGSLKNVGYPFWGDGRPQHCGHRMLQLQCIDDLDGYFPFLKIGSTDLAPYPVLDITASDRNTTLILQGGPSTSCASYGKDIGEVLQFSRSVEKINLVYGCNKGLVPKHNDGNVSCYQQNLTRVQAYYRHNMSAHGEYESCKATEIPVLRKDLDRYNKGVVLFSDVISKGFEVNFEYSSGCIKCRNSAGCVCGSSSSSSFVCLCKPALSKLKRLIIIGSVGIGMLIALAWWCLRKGRPTRKFAAFWKSEATTCPNVDAFLQIYGSFALTRHKHANLKKITNGFREKLGEGGYAIVYKGKLSNGRLVAVKVLKQSKGDGEDFINEVASLSRTNHVNIMPLLGFCFEGNMRALIYEFMPNGSLDKFRYQAAAQSLPWETLYNIAIGIAKGLDYLHRGCNARILHFDIKPHNILLDEELCPKISDFGLARLCPLQESTISMMEARGTIGYIAPEVFCRNFGGVSHKSDVYSFGMMALDMVCGRNNLSADQQKSSDLYFPKWIYDRLETQEETAFQGTTNDEEKALQRKMILVSLWCIQTYPSNRPSMSRVVDMLQGCLESIQMPPKPDLSSPPRLAVDTSGTVTQTQ